MKDKSEYPEYMDKIFICLKDHPLEVLDMMRMLLSKYNLSYTPDYPYFACYLFFAKNTRHSETSLLSKIIEHMDDEQLKNSPLHEIYFRLKLVCLFIDAKILSTKEKEEEQEKCHVSSFLRSFDTIFPECRLYFEAWKKEQGNVQ